jgi:hypothetical protein
VHPDGRGRLNVPEHEREPAIESVDSDSSEGGVPRSRQESSARRALCEHEAAAPLVAVPPGPDGERHRGREALVRRYAARHQAYYAPGLQFGGGREHDVRLRLRRRDGLGCTRFGWRPFVTAGAKLIEAREDTDDHNGYDDDPGDAWAHRPVLRLARPCKQVSRTVVPALAGRAEPQTNGVSSPWVARNLEVP